MAGLALIGFDNMPVASEIAMKAVRWVHGAFRYLMSWVLLGLSELRYDLLPRAVTRCFMGYQHFGRPWSFFDCFPIDGANY